MVSRCRAWVELGAVVLTGLAFLFFENVLHQKLAFLIPCVALWAGYAGYRLRELGTAARWGLAFRPISPALREALICLAVGVVVLGSYRLVRGWRPLPSDALLLFLLYPVWALLQQFVVQGLIVGNLERLGASRALILPVAALLFGLAHAPDWVLAGLCAGAGLVWTWVFLRTRNLYPLAVCHAWLGALAYYWVLERNPWKEMMP